MTPLPDAIDEFLAALRTERGLAANTIHAYRRDLEQYRAVLADRGVESIDDVGESEVAAYLAWMRKHGWKRSTIVRKLAAVNGLHRFAVREELVGHDPTAMIERPSPGRSLPKALTVDETLRLIECPDPVRPLGRRNRALLEFMYATGARVAETVAVDLDDVDYETNTVRLTGKGDRQRIVPLGRHAVAALEHYLPERLELKRGRGDPGAMFVNARGGRLSRQGVYDIVRRAARTAGIDPARVSPHVLRHSAATHMVEGGADLRTVQELLGHANISTTQVYTRVSPQHLLEVFVTSHPRSA